MQSKTKNSESSQDQKTFESNLPKEIFQIPSIPSFSEIQSYICKTKWLIYYRLRDLILGDIDYTPIAKLIRTIGTKIVESKQNNIKFHEK